MERASQQAQTQTTETPEGARAATPESAKTPSWPGYFGNRAALRRLAGGWPRPDPVEIPSAAPLRISRKCAHCEEDDKQANIQRKTNPAVQRKANGAAPPIAGPSVQQALASPGEPLDTATRAFMEPRFGRSFDQVSVHTGAQPAESARSIGAAAYTVGNKIVFDGGRFAPQTDQGRRLLAHELTHVVQQGSGAVARRVQRDLIYGSDYKSPYSKDDAETKSSEAGTWYPSTVDFTATASGSGGGSGSATFDDLIKAIAAKGKGSITSLGIIGHATTDLISLSGTITVNPANVTFTGGGVIDSVGIKAKMADITAVRDRFAAGAKIILYGCHAGIGNSLMTQLSNAFQVCVEGFSDEVWWCISWNLPSRKIISRGRTYVDTSGMMAAGLTPKDCQKTFNADIGQLKPDKKDCSGVPKAAGAKPDAPKAQDSDAGGATPNATSQAAPDAQPAAQEAPAGVQTKLVVNTPGDVFEQEADRVAEQVMRTPAPVALDRGPALASAPAQIQRDKAPVDAAATAAEVEQMVRPGNNEQGALDKLKALDMADLLKVVEQLYDDGGNASGDEKDEGKRRAYGLLNGDLAPPVAGAAPAQGPTLSEDDRVRLKAAFDAAPSRKLRNPTDTDKGTNPTVSAARDMSSAKGIARPGDWGEDPAGNTWVCHTDGIRSYFGTPITSKSKMRTSTWLGNNPSNFDYTPSFTKRAIGSFHWGTGVHHFAIYLTEADASADLRERVAPYSTIIAYIRVHLGNSAKDNNRSPEDYVKDMQRAVAVNENDPCSSWTADPAKWANLIKGFKSAEGWKEVEPITAANVKGRSSDPKDASLITYYEGLLGVTP
ncbi:MAG TPA: DUF4157 domain-containing protein [Terracidiphilus sp.]|jgi:hypothetical protein